MSDPRPPEVVRHLTDPDAVDRILRSLPDWFGIEESIVEYVEAARHKPTYLAVDVATGEVRGVLLATRHNERSAEIHLLAVESGHHRRGVGALLVDAFESDARADGVAIAQVKAQGPSLPDENYARTLAFYLAVGYVPLEELHGLWPGIPCLILVKPLAGSDAAPR